MKWLAMINMLGVALALHAEGFWIQVLSAEKVPEAFEKRVENAGHSCEVIDADGEKKVRIGPFATHHDAEKAMNLIRCRVASDAFIVSDEASPKAPVVETVPKEQRVVQGESAAVAEVTAEQGTEEGDQAKAVATKLPCQCICDPRAIKKLELESAVEFYKHSPDYRFTYKQETFPGF